jgi:hypothetical protein
VEVVDDRPQYGNDGHRQAHAPASPNMIVTAIAPKKASLTNGIYRFPTIEV